MSLKREPLSTNQRAALALINRSPSDSNGWRRVSSGVWPVIANLPDTLVERERNEDGSGRIRFTNIGLEVYRYD